jgi:DNA-directed RNA polymerase subunit RPC12/RpoP
MTKIICLNCKREARPVKTGNRPFRIYVVKAPCVYCGGKVLLEVSDTHRDDETAAPLRGLPAILK